MVCFAMASYAEAQKGWDSRRLVYGDWTWFVRDGLDVLRLAFVAGTIVFAVQGDPDTGALTAAAAVLLVARVIDLPRWLDFGLIVAISLIAWGTALGLYGHWFYYDKVVHGLSPVGYVPVLYIALVRLGVVPDPGQAIRERRVAQIAGIFIVTLAVGMAVGAGYESVEWLEDKFGILGGNFVKGLWDTETDLLCDTGGSFLGALFLTIWALRGWSSRRVTVVPAPGPQETPAEAAVDRIRPQASSTVGVWQRRFGNLSVAAQGVIAVAAGVVLVAMPDLSLRRAGIIFGVAVLAVSAFELFEVFRHRGSIDVAKRLPVPLALGIVGALMLAWPTISQLTVLYLAGASAVLFAVAETTSLATAARTTHERWIGGLSSIAAFVIGIALLADPRGSLRKAITLLGVYLLVLGLLRLIHAAAAWRRRAR
jgi:uncharacterized membrane protein HdeD (DUF308 family)